MTDCIAVLNAGSSSIKFAIHGMEDGPVQFRGQVEAIGVAPVLKVHVDIGVDSLGHRRRLLEAIAALRHGGTKGREIGVGFPS